MGVLPTLYFAKRLSRTTMSGSGYRVGLVPLQSRCALAAAGSNVAAVRKERRFISDFISPRRRAIVSDLEHAFSLFSQDANVVSTDQVVGRTPWSAADPRSASCTGLKYHGQ